MASAILDPTGQTGRGQAVRSLAPRRADLRGARVGLLETPKHNADVFMAEVGRLLTEEHGATVAMRHRKTNIAAQVPEDVAGELVRGCDVVVTGVGDCGSCSASAVADGIMLERRGVATAVICTDAFEPSAGAMAQVQGFPDYRYLTTPHPLAVLTPDEARERARRLVGDVVTILVGREEAKGAA